MLHIINSPFFVCYLVTSREQHLLLSTQTTKPNMARHFSSRCVDSSCHSTWIVNFNKLGANVLVNFILLSASIETICLILVQLQYLSVIVNNNNNDLNASSASHIRSTLNPVLSVQDLIERQRSHHSLALLEKSIYKEVFNII
jgi:hypothetical protein